MTMSPNEIDPNNLYPNDIAPAVECADVTKEFGEGETRVKALRGASLEVRFGEMTMIAGPSGCGKTTLLSVVSGLLDRTSGEMRVLGVDVDAMSGRERVTFRRENIGFVFQQYNLLPALTAAENAAVPLVVAGESFKSALVKSRELLSRLGLESRTEALPREMSGGQQQRVALARAVIHAPRLLVCDEPTSALDGESGRHVMELLRDAAVSPERAVVVVTHDPRVMDFADVVAHMDDGRVSRVERPLPNNTIPHLTNHVPQLIRS
jgi:putative ABC transport system ATP-binding protein